jgi:hypothetical protein
MHYLASDQFDAQKDCGENCLQTRTNSWLDKYNKGFGVVPDRPGAGAFGVSRNGWPAKGSITKRMQSAKCWLPVSDQLTTTDRHYCPTRPEIVKWLNRRHPDQREGAGSRPRP